MSARATDPPDSVGLTLRRFPGWAIGVIVSVAGTGIASWAQLQSLGDKLNGITQTQQTTTQQLGEITRSLNTTNLKDLEHDLKIQSLTSRTAALEALYPRGVVPPPPPLK